MESSDSVLGVQTTIFFMIFFLVATCTPGTDATPDTDFIRRSCSKTLHATICLNTLSPLASSIHSDPVLLVSAALNTTLTGTHSASATFTAVLAANARSGKQQGPIKDCLEELADAAQELQRSTELMTRLGGQRLGEQVDDLQTWVSAALTNANTCLEGFRGGGNSGGPRGGAHGTGLEGEARERVAEAAQMASNALYFINALVTPASPDSQDELAAQD